MIKWVILAIGAVLLTCIVIKIIKVMLKAEKDSNQKSSSKDETTQEEYIPEERPIDIHSASSGVPITDMSSKDKEVEADFVNSVLDDMPISDSGFIDSIDDDFDDYSKFAHSKGRRRPPIDFDLDGDFADEYIPDSPDFNYLPRRRPQKKKTIEKELNDLPTELKVLMLSDIFDRKFFD